MSLKTLLDAVEQRKPVKCIVHDAGVEYLVTHLVEREDDFVWGQEYWFDDPTSHGVHVVNGKVTGTGPWQCGKLTFAEFDEDDTLALAYGTYMAFERMSKRDYLNDLEQLANAV